MITKIHADLINGIIEVEGSEEFVTNSFKEFRESFDQIKQKLPAKNAVYADFDEAEISSAPEKSKSKTKSKTKTSSSGSKTNLTVVQEFHDGKQGKDFLEEIKKYTIPDSEQKLVVLYIYLMRKVGVTGITFNHVHTAYRLQGKKTPSDLRSVINNAKRRTSYLMYTSLDDLQTNHKGDDFVEIDLLEKPQ